MPGNNFSAKERSLAGKRSLLSAFPAWNFYLLFINTAGPSAASNRGGALLRSTQLIQDLPAFARGYQQNIRY